MKIHTYIQTYMYNIYAYTYTYTHIEIYSYIYYTSSAILHEKNRKNKIFTQRIMIIIRQYPYPPLKVRKKNTFRIAIFLNTDSNLC